MTVQVRPWQAALAGAIRDAEIELVAYVPDGRLVGVVAALIERGQQVRTLTREEACIAYAGGYAAAGGRPAVLMQCSGLGNSINAIASFLIPYGIGVPLVVSMRGTLGERNPSQVPMGRATPALLAALPVQAFGASSAQTIRSTAAGVFELAYSTGAPAALLLEASLDADERG